MNKELYQEILNLSMTVFNDMEYKQVVLLTQKHEYNLLRIKCSEKVDYYNAIENFTSNDSVIETQLKCSNKLEDIFTDLYIAKLTAV